MEDRIGDEIKKEKLSEQVIRSLIELKKRKFRLSAYELAKILLGHILAEIEEKEEKAREEDEKEQEKKANRNNK